MYYRNAISGEKLSHFDFVVFVWSEAERQFNECNPDEYWCNLTQTEQIEIYCDQFEHQLNDRYWQMIKEDADEIHSFY